MLDNLEVLFGLVYRASHAPVVSPFPGAQVLGAPG